MEPLRSKRSALAWALVVAGCGATLGCGDPRKASEIAREEPPALSLAADNRPGEGPSKAPAPAPNGQPKAQATAPEAPDLPEAQEGDGADGDRASEASASSRRRAVSRGPARRRRAASTEVEGGGEGERGGADKGARADTGTGTGARADTGAGTGEGTGAGARAGDRAVASVPLKVARLVVARSVSGREPVGVARSFAAGEAERLYAFVELTNAARAPSEIFVTFVPQGGGDPHRIRLEVGAERRWRTWATTRRVRAAGRWSVVVTDAEGVVLGQTSFTLTK